MYIITFCINMEVAKYKQQLIFGNKTYCTKPKPKWAGWLDDIKEEIAWNNNRAESA